MPYRHRIANGLVAAVLVLSMVGSSVVFAREVSAPEGCYLQIDREGTFICCPKREAIICRQQPSRLPTRAL